jgi:hypothetical protein
MHLQEANALLESARLDIFAGKEFQGFYNGPASSIPTQTN